MTDAMKTESNPFHSLSPQQKLVAIHVWFGLPDKQVGAALGISKGTVRLHLQEICRKFGCTNRIQVAVLVERSYGPATLAQMSGILRDRRGLILNHKL